MCRGGSVLISGGLGKREKLLILILLVLWLAFHLAVPIHLSQVDLGRHIKNGELITQGQWTVLYKNYYSYTCPQYPFINHHWLFGVFCYVLWYFFGFTGLSLSYLLIELLTFLLFFYCWRRFSDFSVLCAFGLLSFPLICGRSEIRPEGFSYLFCGLFCYLIDMYHQGRIKPLHLAIILSLIQLIWVNMHIFFIMGPLLMVLFWCQAKGNVQVQEANLLRNIFLLLLGACLVNPSGLYGALLPFHIGIGYKFPVTELKSVFYYFNLIRVPSVLTMMNHELVFFSNLFFIIDKSLYIYFFCTMALLIVVLVSLVQQEGYKKYIFSGGLFIILSLEALTAVRMIGLYGLFWIPLASQAYSKISEKWTAPFRQNMGILLVLTGILTSASVNCDWTKPRSLEMGSDSNNAMEFFKKEGISGPVFNNFNIGSYLIFYLAPQYKIFVDNRMEAYPVDFLRNMDDHRPFIESYWQTMDQQYQFNVIFWQLDTTAWGGRFMMNRLRDPHWALIYLDNDKMVILLKRTKQNASIIKRFEKHVTIRIMH